MSPLNARIVAAACLATLGIASAPASAALVSQWTFETSAPAAAGPYAPESGSGAATGFHAGASTYSSPVGNGSAHSFSSNTWAVGDYYQFSTSTTGYSGITLAWDQISSSTGPGSFKLSYSTNGTSFTDFVNYSVVVNASPNTWSSGAPASGSSYSYNLGSITALNNAATVYFRLVDASATAAGGGTVATAGTDRVDNFSVSATPSAVPLPGAAWLLGSGVLVLFRNRRRPLA